MEKESNVEIEGLTLQRGKLTKKFLLDAPAGRYLASNCGFPPIFGEVIESSISERMTQWERIVRVAANGRICYIYASKNEYDTVHLPRLINLVNQSRGETIH